MTQNEDPKYIIFDNRGSFIKSIQREVIQIGFIFFVMWTIPYGRWLTLFTGFSVLALHWGYIEWVSKRQKKFTSKLELQAWVNSLEDDHNLQ